MPGEWDEETEDWVEWARTPGFDAYWYYRDTFFDSVVPHPRGRTLEVGCGEGRVTRDLRARGHMVAAVDTAVGLVRHARVADSDSWYLAAGGAQLPFASGSFDLVVAYNALQVVDDMAATVAECARVLADDGRLCFCVAHPLTDLGHWDSAVDPPRLAIRAGYFSSERVEDTVEVGGHRMTFRGWTYSLEAYANALRDAGFVIEIIGEPTPRGTSGYDRWLRVPMFMNVRAARPSRPT
jgi:SAM-dependent methyltransferase